VVRRPRNREKGEKKERGGTSSSLFMSINGGKKEEKDAGMFQEKTKSGPCLLLVTRPKKMSEGGGALIDLESGGEVQP